ncbi:hypothetical protein [Asticcacaulis solisilvae]|uniref:hypothetical protein n=1 Tax=Asticcacaulis solisilvae TaxID=1217274 RepID=UPI003FD7DECB
MTDADKTPSKTAREEALEKALRDNLRRRKAAARDAVPPETPELHEKASGNSGQST